LISSFNKGPFTTFTIQDHDRPNIEWTGLKFSSDGNKILITTKQDVILIIDGFFFFD